MKLVLMYHGIDKPARFGEARYTVDAASFTSQLRTLSGQATNIAEFLSGDGNGAVLLTFDDGEKSVVDKALPAMSEHGMTGTAFITTGWIGTPSYMDADDLARLSEAGWTLGTHGVTHRFLTELSDNELEEELAASRETLRLITGIAPKHLALPGGRGDRRVVEAARNAGYRSLFTSRTGLNRDALDPMAIRRYSVVQSMSDKEFRNLVAGDWLLHLKLQLRQRALDAGKRFLGEERYIAIRAQLTRALRGPEPTP